MKKLLPYVATIKTKNVNSIKYGLKKDALVDNGILLCVQITSYRIKSSLSSDGFLEIELDDLNYGIEDLQNILEVEIGKFYNIKTKSGGLDK